MSMVVSSALSESDVSALLPLVSAVSAASNNSPTLLDLNLDWRTFLSMLEVVRVEQASVDDFSEKEAVDGVDIRESVVFRLNSGEKSSSDEEKTLMLDFGVLLFAPYFQKKISYTEMVELVERLQRKEVIGLLLNVWLERNIDVDGKSHFWLPKNLQVGVGQTHSIRSFFPGGQHFQPKSPTTCATSANDLIKFICRIPRLNFEKFVCGLSVITE